MDARVSHLLSCVKNSEGILEALQTGKMAAAEETPLLTESSVLRTLLEKLSSIDSMTAVAALEFIHVLISNDENGSLPRNLEIICSDPSNAERLLRLLAKEDEPVSDSAWEVLRQMHSLCETEFFMLMSQCQDGFKLLFNYTAEHSSRIKQCIAASMASEAKSRALAAKALALEAKRNMPTSDASDDAEDYPNEDYPNANALGRELKALTDFVSTLTAQGPPCALNVHEGFVAGPTGVANGTSKPSFGKEAAPLTALERELTERREHADLIFKDVYELNMILRGITTRALDQLKRVLEHPLLLPEAETGHSVGCKRPVEADGPGIDEEDIGEGASIDLKAQRLRGAVQKLLMPLRLLESGLSFIHPYSCEHFPRAPEVLAPFFKLKAGEEFNYESEGELSDSLDDDEDQAMDGDDEEPLPSDWKC